MPDQIIVNVVGQHKYIKKVAQHVFCCCCSSSVSQQWVVLLLEFKSPACASLNSLFNKGPPSSQNFIHFTGTPLLLLLECIPSCLPLLNLNSLYPTIKRTSKPRVSIHIFGSSVVVSNEEPLQCRMAHCEADNKQAEDDDDGSFLSASSIRVNGDLIDEGLKAMQAQDHKPPISLFSWAVWWVNGLPRIYLREEITSNRIKVQLMLLNI